MTSFGYRSNPHYAIKECSSCGSLYTRDCVCPLGTVEDKILVPKPPKNCARCTRCGYLIDGPNCQGCARLRQELEENLVIHSPDFQNSFEPSNASTNVVNAPREPYVVKQDNGSFVDKIIFDLNRAPDSPNQFPCFHCKDVLRDGEACKRCTCAKCRSDAHIGYNCPSNVPVISNPEPCNNQTIDELPQALPIFHLTFHSEDESPVILDSTPTYVDESPNVSNPPPQSPVYPCEFYENDAYYGHYCTPQAPFIYPEPCYNQDFNFPMGDEHLDTISATESDKFIKSCVENLVPNPSESEGESEYDVPAGFTTFSNVLFDADYDFNSGDAQQHPFNAESDLIDSMPNHDSSITISLKMDSLFDEFASELTLLKSFPPIINETDCRPEKEIRLAKRLLYDNSSPRPPRPPEEIVSDNSNADIESFSPSPIPNLDSDPLMEEIDLSFNPDDPMPPGIEDDDCDSGRDISILEELLDNYSLSLPA
nr:hypothetical protein [Tanacetum cinerariifolium]